MHDSRIFHNSRLCAEFENGNYNGSILGDSGYALKSYLLTPVSNPQAPPERRYNIAHCRTQNTVECMFGVWKRRFMCVGSMLRVKIATALAIIVATAILHNKARDRKEEISGTDYNFSDDEDNALPQLPGNRLCHALRQRIIQQIFL